MEMNLYKAFTPARIYAERIARHDIYPPPSPKKQPRTDVLFLRCFFYRLLRRYIGRDFKSLHLISNSYIVGGVGVKNEVLTHFFYRAGRHYKYNNDWIQIIPFSIIIILITEYTRFSGLT